MTTSPIVLFAAVLCLRQCLFATGRPRGQWWVALACLMGCACVDTSIRMSADGAPPRRGPDAAGEGGAATKDACSGAGGSETPEGPNSESREWHHVPIVGGGFVTGIVYSESEPGLVYARTDIGGLYRRESGDPQWNPLTDWVGRDDTDLMGIESVATDPVDPDRLYVAAGLYTNDWSDRNGVLLRSRDRGRTFDQVPFPFKFGGNMPGRSMGERLAVDPNQHDIVYYGARSGHGLWRSIDAGARWTRVESFTATGDWADEFSSDAVGIVWVVFDPRTAGPSQPTQVIYVGVADTAAAIHRSVDGGKSWEPVPGQPRNGYLPHHGVLAKNGVLYLTYSDTAGPYDGSKGDVWKFDTATESWTRISPVPSDSDQDYFGYGGLAVDAQHPETLVVSTMNSWWPDAILFRSVDGGNHWSRIWDWGRYPERKLRYSQDISVSPWLNLGVTNPVAPVPAVWLGWMIGDIEIDPFDSDIMTYVTGATVFGTDHLTAWDTGGTVDLSVRALGIEETVIHDLISPPTGAPLLSAVGDLGGFRHDDLARVPDSVMTNPVFTSGTSLDYAELLPEFMVRVGFVNAEIGSSHAAFSHDGGATWAPSAAEPAEAAGGMVAAAADGTRVLWRPYQSKAFYSLDGGAQWSESAGLPASAWIGSDRVNPEKFYGYAQGTFFVSMDGGITFTPSPAKNLPVSAVQFKATPGFEGDLWLAGGSRHQGRYGLWHSADGGTTFTKLATVQGADIVGFGQPAPGQDFPAIYAAAEVEGAYGIFRSDDQGANWVRLNDNCRQYGPPWLVLTGDPRVYGRVYLGTAGRGIVYSDIGAGAPE